MNILEDQRVVRVAARCASSGDLKETKAQPRERPALELAFFRKLSASDFLCPVSSASSPSVRVQLIGVFCCKIYCC